MQTTAEHGLISPAHHMKTLVLQDGPLALYRGLPLPLLGTMAETACVFTTMGQVKRVLYGPITPQKRITTAQTCIAGGISGFFISFLLTPILTGLNHLVLAKKAFSEIFNLIIINRYQLTKWSC